MANEEEVQAVDGKCPEGYELIGGVCVKKAVGPIIAPPPPIDEID
jgi:hypothetical protein